MFFFQKINFFLIIYKKKKKKKIYNYCTYNLNKIYEVQIIHFVYQALNNKY